MSLAAIIIIGITIVLFSIIIVFAAATFLTKKKNPDVVGQKQKYNKRFRFYYDFALTRQSFRKVHGQVSSMSIYNMIDARVVTVKFYERALITSTVLFLVTFILLGDIISGIIMLLFAMVMLDVTISNRIDDVNFQSLKSISSLILSIRECYTRCRNVPDALNDATVPPLLQRNVDDIYLICTATDAKTRLNNFYKECPNRIMRTLATTCYIRADVGEDDAKGGSPFKEALGLIKDEVDMEVRRQLNQRIMFNMLDKLPLVPLFLYPIIKVFYVKIISATASVFDGGIGYCIKLAVVLSCFICYYILSTINNTSAARTDDRLLSLVNLLHHDRMAKFARTLVPKSFKKRHATEEKLKGCLSQKDLTYFYFEKYFFAVSAFFASIVFSIIIMISAKQAVYNSLISDTMSVQLTYTAEQEAAVRKYDAEVLAMDELPSEEEMFNFFRSTFMKYTTNEVDAQVDRLTRKYSTYHNLHFYWWLALVYIAVYYIAFYVPDFLLKLRRTLVKSEADMDVLQLQTVIAIMMDTPLDTMSVLFWLAKSSDIHKDILNYCYHEYVRDPIYAIRHLQSKSVSTEFSAICDKLITTVYQVTLAEAFEDLIGERQNMMKMREVVQLDQLKSKRNIASPIAMAPMGVWLVAVFIVPIAVVAVRSFVSMLGNLNM